MGSPQKNTSTRRVITLSDPVISLLLSLLNNRLSVLFLIKESKAATQTEQEVGCCYYHPAVCESPQRATTAVEDRIKRRKGMLNRLQIVFRRDGVGAQSISCTPLSLIFFFFFECLMVSTCYTPRCVV